MTTDNNEFNMMHGQWQAVRPLKDATGREEEEKQVEARQREISKLKRCVGKVEEKTL